MDAEDQMLFINFNQDSSCFVTGTEKGFRVYNSYPFKDNYEKSIYYLRKDLDGGIAIIEMLYRTNIVALVGGGKSPKFPPHKVILWDDHQGKKCETKERYVRKINHNSIIIVLDKKIYIFNFMNFQIIETIETYENSKGIIAVSSDPKINVIAFPDKTKGYVTVKKYENYMNISTNTISCHDSNIFNLALNSDGTILATTSDKGTVIKIFKADSKAQLQELRVGNDGTEIYYISFHDTSKYLAVSCERGMIYIFSLHTAVERIEKDNDNFILKNDEEKILEPHNKKSVFSFLQNIINIDYLKSEWSFAQFRIPDLKSICAFSSNNKLVVVSSEGMYYLAEFDLIKGGECTKQQECKLVGN